MTTPSSNVDSAAWRLSPSDFSFLWEDCRRCFYLKVVRGLWPPKGPMPAMFTKIAGLQDRYFTGKRTEDLVPQLPPGRFVYGEERVRSRDIVVPDHPGRCYIAGRFDTVIEFDDGTYGVVDFKTSETKTAYKNNYSRQLHAYAFSLENPAPGAFARSPVSVLGLLCLDVVEFGRGKQRSDVYYLRCNPVWVPFERDEAGFLRFIGEVLRVLSLPTPPPPAAGCNFCRYQDEVAKIGKTV